MSMAEVKSITTACGVHDINDGKNVYIVLHQISN